MDDHDELRQMARLHHFDKPFGKPYGVGPCMDAIHSLVDAYELESRNGVSWKTRPGRFDHGPGFWEGRCSWFNKISTNLPFLCAAS